MTELEWLIVETVLYKNKTLFLEICRLHAEQVIEFFHGSLTRLEKSDTHIADSFRNFVEFMEIIALLEIHYPVK